MRRWALVVGAVLCATAGGSTAAVAATTTSSPGVRVAPRTIGPRTNVTVRFTQPESTGTVAGTRRVERVRVTGPARAGCIDSRTERLVAAPAGTRMRFTLRPASLGGRWCAGTYQGAVFVDMAPDCARGAAARACPLWIMPPRPVASFRFRVTTR